MSFQHVGLAEIQGQLGRVSYSTLSWYSRTSLRTTSRGEQHIEGLSVTRLEGRDATHYPLSLMVEPCERLHLRLDYDPTRFSRQAAETIGGRFVRLLEQGLPIPIRHFILSTC